MKNWFLNIGFKIDIVSSLLTNLNDASCYRNQKTFRPKKSAPSGSKV